MSIIAYEKAGSPRVKFADDAGNAKSLFESLYIVIGTTSATEARDAAKPLAPTAISVSGDVLLRQTFDVQPLGPDSWEVTVDYGPEDEQASQDRNEPGTWQFSFDTTGGVHTVTQSLDTIWRGERSASNPAPDLLGAVGYDGMKVHGAEIVVPKLEFSVTAYYAPTQVTTTWVANLARATGKTNSASWLSFDAGELLFLGSSGQGDIPLAFGQRVRPIGVTHKFSASENRQNIKVGSITVPSKKGWEHLWVKYERGAIEGKVYPIPVHAYVERMFDAVSFQAVLGFG